MPMTLEEYYQVYGTRITQDSERLFVDDFLYPLLGASIEHVIPQHPFLDSTGRSRRIDFAYTENGAKLALEVNGESYHAEGIIPDETFDDNLFRQNEILNDGYKLVRFSYNQLQSPAWRPIVKETLQRFFSLHAPQLLGESPITPNPLQRRALEALEFYRTNLRWRKGIVVLPPGTGKTFLSAIDSRQFGGRVLFLVHRLDILKQSIDAYKRVLPEVRTGVLTGEERTNVEDCEVLFASKDTLRQPDVLSSFSPLEFGYLVVDEVHHGQSASYQEILRYFRPGFMLGMTATPDRTDRKDIFELFDYNKVLEVSLQEAIEDGYLVPYTYYGLLDNIDYSKIRFQNNRFHVGDLEKYLIIPERNEAIIEQYLELGCGDKAIGFCVSIRHAERMAEVFNAHGITAAAVTSLSADRDRLIDAFRRSQITVVFTVDLFNEGVDFPDVRVLLFLRPTESKTVFLQQLGRGLRLCTGKERVRILDFIGNYRRANQIRKWLSKESKTHTRREGGRIRKKTEYIYNTDCEVRFAREVEEILDRQDEESAAVTADDLREAYFALAESLGRKPTRTDLDYAGTYPSSQYLQRFGSWRNFLQDVGEYTEASYHYPQGVHLGHLLAILDVFGAGRAAGSQYDEQYVRLRGELGTGRIAIYRRQAKYKLQAAMELGIITDDRLLPSSEMVSVTLTPLGREMYAALRPLLGSLDLSVKRDEEGIPSSRMRLEPHEYSTHLRTFLTENGSARELVVRAFLRMPAVTQMLNFLYRVTRRCTVDRNEVYSLFFQAPFVRSFLDREGIEEATPEAARRRCPFLLNVLDALGVISQGTPSIDVMRLLITAPVVRATDRESLDEADQRALRLYEAWPNREESLDPQEVSLLRELFGSEFLTDSYFLHEAELVSWN